jgi:hypothetical protein
MLRLPIVPMVFLFRTLLEAMHMGDENFCSHFVLTLFSLCSHFVLTLFSLCSHFSLTFILTYRPTKHGGKATQ